MFRIILPVALLLVLVIAGCTEPPAQAQHAPTSDPVLLATFFGPGVNRTISPVIRCPVRCQAVR